MSLLDTVGGRRFILVSGCCIVTTLLLMAEALTEGIYKDVIEFAIAIYVGGNVAQRFIESKAPKSES